MGRRDVNRPATVEPFIPEETALTRAMSAGHVHRCGHTLTGYWTHPSPGVRELRRTCCHA